MQEYDIPASIILAQAILESKYGNSYLAKVANNHFGIRYYNSKYFKGDYYYSSRTKRKWRKYNSVFESYKDYVAFLLNTDKRRKDREGKFYPYHQLFKLRTSQDWVEKMSSLGYAQSKTYEKKLKHIIQKYKLEQIDAMLRSRQHYFKIVK